MGNTNSTTVNGFTGIPTEEAEAFEEIFKKDGPNGCLEYINTKREEWRTIPLNVAVIGRSGSGKSTFINTMRGLKGKDHGAAAVSVHECTTVVKPYPHPDNEMLVFWDVPGVGTASHPQETYLESIQVDTYDCFIIMTSKRFYTLDSWLAKELKKRKKFFYFVRSHIGVDVQNDQYEKELNHNAARLLQYIRDVTMENVKKELDFEVPLFLIDSHQRFKFDFNALEERIIEDLPQNKKNAMVLSLFSFSVGMTKAKVYELRKRAWGMAILSASIAAVPVPGVSIVADMAILLGEARFYYKTLGLDKESLQRRANLLSVEVSPMLEIVQRSFPTEISISLIRSMVIDGVSLVRAVAIGSVYVGGTIFEEMTRLVPFVGALVAAPISLAVTRYTLGCILDKMEEVALKIADFTADCAMEGNL